MTARLASRMRGISLIEALVALAVGGIGMIGMVGVQATLRGNADARSMASGVSEAMICTMTGLAVSITGLYPVHYFRTRAAHETALLADRLPL